MNVSDSLNIACSSLNIRELSLVEDPTSVRLRVGVVPLPGEGAPLREKLSSRELRNVL